MAIVKTRYVRGKSRIKAHLRYITHRRGMEGERITRALFGKDGALSKQQVYDMIDAARRGAVFHKFVINFHPLKEDTNKDLNLWEITRKTLEHIKTQYGLSVPFVATIHDDHTALRHVHGFFIVEGRLNKEEFAKIKGLWKVASAEVRHQRNRLDRMHKSLRFQKLLPLIEKYKRKREQGRGGDADAGHPDAAGLSTLRLWGYVRHACILSHLPQLQTMAHAKQARLSARWKEAAPVMLRGLFRVVSLVISWLDAFFNTTQKAISRPISLQA